MGSNPSVGTEHPYQLITYPTVKYFKRLDLDQYASGSEVIISIIQPSAIELLGIPADLIKHFGDSRFWRSGERLAQTLGLGERKHVYHGSRRGAEGR